MITYTSCRRCGGLLHITNHDTVHPLCDPKPTKAERLGQAWLTAINNDDQTLADSIEADINELDSAPPRFLDAALAYAAWGWPVFPLRALSKTPATRNGFKDATTDPDRIRAWWETHPDSNIGLPTGLAFDVIDVDVPHGPITFAQMIADGLVPDAHGHVATSSGGMHLYILPTGDGNKAGLLPGIDYRGVGGYVVAPPSTLGEPGRAWCWVSKPSPSITKSASVTA